MKKNRIKLIGTVLLACCISLEIPVSSLHSLVSYAAQRTIAYSLDITPPESTPDVGSFISTAIQNALNTNDTVIVNGRADLADSNSTKGIEINIPQGKKIIWRAFVTGNLTNDPVLKLNSSDEAEFEFAAGEITSAIWPALTDDAGSKVNIKITGGELIKLATGNENTVIIKGYGNFDMSGGRIINYSDSPALELGGHGQYNIRGGVLFASGSNNTTNLKNGNNALSTSGPLTVNVNIDLNKASIITWDSDAYNLATPMLHYINGGYDNRHLKVYPGSATQVSWTKDGSGAGAIKYTNPNGEHGVITQGVALVDDIDFPTLPSDITYDKTAKGLESIEDPEGNTIDFKYMGINGTNYPISNTKPINAGEYKVSATLSPTYGSLTVDLGVLKINKRAVTIKVDNKTINKDTEVPAVPQSFTDFTVENLAAGDNNQDALVAVPSFSWNTDGHTVGNFNITTTSSVSYKNNYMSATPGLLGMLTVVDPGTSGTPSTPGTTPSTPGTTPSTPGTPGTTPGKKDKATPSDSKKATPSNPSKPSKSSKKRGSGSRSKSKQLRAAKKTVNGTWIQDTKGWWYKEPDGSYPKSKWMELSYNGVNRWYYFDETGYMSTGWKLINGKWYYMYEKTEGLAIKGAMASNTRINGYYVGSNGAWIE